MLRDVTTQQKDTGAKSKAMELVKDKLNIRYKGLQTTVDKNTKKRIDQVARKTIRIATKVKDPRTFEQKYKNIDGEIERWCSKFRARLLTLFLAANILS